MSTIKVWVKRGPAQQAVLGDVRAMLAKHKPRYTVLRRCTSGDVEYRAVLATVPQGLVEALWRIGAAPAMQEAA